MDRGLRRAAGDATASLIERGALDLPGGVPAKSLLGDCISRPPGESSSLTMEDERPYDVVIIGGALAGAATATLLVRQNPGIRVLIVEKSAQFSRRVGEATVEVSAY
ncbi:MAG: tryptophan 7-halogenase, partial [Verrucomicrobiota bacterium]|nr:tryptophan 7-halogenase [Verrucomicrobiota bacterium]